MESERRRTDDPAPVIDAYTQARVLRPGCQHHLGCKCSVPYHLRPSSPAELRRERLIQLSPAGLELITTALRVVERRRDELKRENEQLCAQRNSALAAASGTSSSQSVPAASIPSTPLSTSAPTVKTSGQGSESAACGTPGASACPVSAVLPHAVSESRDRCSAMWLTLVTQMKMNRTYSSCGRSLQSFSRVNSTST